MAPSSSPYKSSRNSAKAAYSPSAPPAPDPNEPKLAYPYDPSQSPQDYYYSSSSSSSYYAPSAHNQTPTNIYNAAGGSNYESGQAPYSYGYNYPHQQQQYYQSYHQYEPFSPGTHPDVIRSFQMVDRDRSGFIEERELQEALSSGYQRFNIRTIRLLIFLFRNPFDSALRIGPKEFSALWNCLAQWRATFERFDRDHSGKIDAAELKDALRGTGFSMPPSVLQVLISRYDERNGRRVELNFDSFVECGMIVKGLTEKFKAKDPRCTGSATLTYDTFMSMIIPFLISY